MGMSLSVVELLVMVEFRSVGDAKIFAGVAISDQGSKKGKLGRKLFICVGL
jgi:hypothetical protein